MRLGQLARHLDISSQEIVEYLALKQVEIKDHPNVKLTEEQEEIVIRHFNPDGFSVRTEPETTQASLLAESTTATNVSADLEAVTYISETVNTITEDVAAEEPMKALVFEPEESHLVDATETALNVAEEPEEVISANVQLVEVAIGEMTQPEKSEILIDELEDHPINRLQDGIIKAPKVELRGLKVVGKIELPQSKAKSEVETEESSTENTEESISGEETSVPTATVEDTSKVRYFKHQERNRRPKLTPQQLEEKRIRNKKAQERRIKEQEERAKEKAEKAKKEMKEQHYKEKISNSASVKKASKKKKKSTSGSTQSAKTKLPPPKTLLGKFWRWLNT